MKKICSMVLAVGFVLALSTSAKAYTIGTIPGGQTNDFISTGLFGSATTVSGLYGAQLWLNGPADLTFEYFGAEAGFINEFNFNNGEVKFVHPGGGSTVPGTLTPIATDTVDNVSSGLLDFRFYYNNYASSVINGSNPDDGAGTVGPNFFMSFNPFSSSTGVPLGGNYVFLFLDDGGANNDDNHDDMVVKITATGNFYAVPEPGTILLLGSGLLGLGLIRRRQQNRG